MSYILDALKRADAERERGAVPGLHAQPAAMALPDEPASGGMPPWAWGLGGLGVALVAMLAWSMWRGDEPAAESHAQGPATAQDAPPRQPGAWNGPGDRPAPSVGMASGAWEAQAERQPPGRIPPREGGGPPHPAGMSRPTNTPTTTQARPAPPSQPGRQATTAQPDTSAATRSAEAQASGTPPSRVYALHELPDHVRRNLPQLVIGGAMYSDSPANRMLVINSQLFHEGDKLGPDLTLEEIKLKSAVLRYKTWRYNVTY